MLDQPYMTDLIEANSMGHEPNLIDIYSASWGPTDDGETVDGPRNATMRAIVRGVNEVRPATGRAGRIGGCTAKGGRRAAQWGVGSQRGLMRAGRLYFSDRLMRR